MIGDEDPASVFLGQAEEGESCRCARCSTPWDVCETYSVDGSAICPECVQEEIDALAAVRDRLADVVARAVEAMGPGDLEALARNVGRSVPDDPLAMDLIAALAKASRARTILRDVEPEKGGG